MRARRTTCRLARSLVRWRLVEPPGTDRGTSGRAVGPVGWWGLAVPYGTSAPPVLRAGRSPIFGREQPLAVLAEQLGEARAGAASVVLVAGAPGIGKTRLLE